MTRIVLSVGDVFAHQSWRAECKARQKEESLYAQLFCNALDEI